MTNENKKPRTIRELAKEAIQVQDACNISGIVRSYFEALCELRAQPECTGNIWLNEHPITRAWASKIADLTRVGGYGDSDEVAMKAHRDCMRLALDAPEERRDVEPFALDHEVGAGGTSLRGETKPITYKAIEKVFGEPEESDGYKVSGEWTFKGRDGRVYTVYDWKATSLYDGEGPTVRTFRNSNEGYEWHIGGTGDVSEFKAWFEKKVS